MVYRSWAEISKKNLLSNLEKIYKFVKKDIFAVIKADAYGHGAVEVGRLIQKIPYVKKFCVATALEGKELRKNGIYKDILVLGGLLKDEIDIFNLYSLTPVISDFKHLELVDKLRYKKIHINFDTGMHRLGFYKEDIEKILKIISEKNILIEGIMTHFPSADIDPDLTRWQIKELKDILNRLNNLNIFPKYIHSQNSAGLVYRCDFCNAVRIGLSMYGEKPIENFPIDISNVMSLKAKLISIKNIKKGDKISYCGTFIAPKDMRIGTVSFGYADGLPRDLSNKGKFILNGDFCHIVGNITMDMTMIDISNIRNAKTGEDVIIIGKQDNCIITFGDVAKSIDTISYEIMCRVSKRVHRFIV